MKIIKGIKNRIISKTWKYYKFYLYNFNRGKLKRDLAARKGRCDRCGRCCVGCILYNEETKLCNDWKIAVMIGCDLYPINLFDQKRLGVENVCGYYWEKK